MDCEDSINDITENLKNLHVNSESCEINFPENKCKE